MRAFPNTTSGSDLQSTSALLCGLEIFLALRAYQMIGRCSSRQEEAFAYGLKLT